MESAAQEKPKTVEEAMRRMRAPEDAPPAPQPVPDRDLPPEDEGGPEMDDLPPDEEDYDGALEAKSGAWPDWVMVPDGMKFPEGKQVVATRFRADWTDKPSLGERQCMMWNLTDADEKLAQKRARGESLRYIDELAKQMIRVIDGKKVDWTHRVAHNPDVFWSDIGAGCRKQLINVYVRRHAFSKEATVDFLTDCIAARTVAG
jgi:hypothetical protein